MAAATAPEARLLVVDDEPNILELLSVSLRFAGFEVATATNGDGRPLRNRLHGAHHEVVLHAPVGDAPPVVCGDDARLHQVLTNLVANAVAHTAAGTRVDVRVARTGGEVTVEVRDHGAGMAPEVASRVFERFYRADSSRTRVGSSTSGTGLGLSIVAALVAAHHGTVTVDAAPGQGSSFTVRLPAQAG